MATDWRLRVELCAHDSLAIITIAISIAKHLNKHCLQPLPVTTFTQELLH
jgi:hypothetical protein